MPPTEPTTPRNPPPSTNTGIVAEKVYATNIAAGPAAQIRITQQESTRVTESMQRMLSLLTQLEHEAQHLRTTLDSPVTTSVAASHEAPTACFDGLLSTLTKVRAAAEAIAPLADALRRIFPM